MRMPVPTPIPMIADAHNHLHDPRLASILDAYLLAPATCGMTVNGTCPGDWPAVAALAERSPQVVPSFGLHPWRVRGRPEGWEAELRCFLECYPDAAVGEIGMDFWIRDPDKSAQRAAFEFQWSLAVELGRPVTVHGLQCWGALLEMVTALPRNPRGLLLHSYGGPPEQIPRWLELGAYFSISPAFLARRKADKLAALRAVPPDRLMVETDAPDMAPPPELNVHLLEPEGRVNHPANIGLALSAAESLFDQSELISFQIAYKTWQNMFLNRKINNGLRC